MADRGASPVPRSSSCSGCQCPAANSRRGLIDLAFQLDLVPVGSNNSMRVVVVVLKRFHEAFASQPTSAGRGWKSWAATEKVSFSFNTPSWAQDGEQRKHTPRESHSGPRGCCFFFLVSGERKDDWRKFEFSFESKIKLAIKVK